LNQAKGLLAKSPPATVADVVNNNKKITRFYAEMYESDPDVFSWFGLAAFASYQVGTGLQKLQTGLNWAPPEVQIAGIRQSDLFAILFAGNQEIFLDIAPVALAYKEGGIDELKRVKPSREMQDAFTLIDKAKGEKTLSKQLDYINRAARDLVRHEQKILQNVIERADKETLRRMNFLFQTQRSLSFPGGDWGLADFGNYQSRIDRINGENGIYVNFMLYRFKNAADVTMFMQKRINEGR
jgi:hypothetical protein